MFAGTHKRGVLSWTRVLDGRASPSHRTQHFVLPSPTWAKFLRFEMTSRYGDESLCTMTHFAAFGKTVFEDVQESDGEDVIKSATDDIKDSFQEADNGSLPENESVLAIQRSNEQFNESISLGSFSSFDNQMTPNEFIKFTIPSQLILV